MEKVKPKKALGQHFLTDLSIAGRITDTLNPWPQMPTIEVGPGMGVLTQFLLQNSRQLKVVEVDTESVDYLRANYPELSDDIIADDFLQLPLDEVWPQSDSIAVIGNYPYNISSQIFFHILDYKDRVKVCSGMLQREVAERIAAPEGSKTRGILSVLLQAWYDVKYLFTVSENVFNPPPKVKSGVIILTRNNVENLGCDERLFKLVVKTTFGQRRKTLRNSIKSLIPPQVLATVPENPMLALRPEQLSVEQFIELTNYIARLRTQSA